MNEETTDIHPDSKYNNWTIRSYDVKTKIEDIPQWMKIYSESSIDTHDFFHFERYDYDELNNWQKMLLKLYREDLKHVIRYYEDYRAAILTEMQTRNRSENEKVHEKEENRHNACQSNHSRQSKSTDPVSKLPPSSASLSVPSASSTPAVYSPVLCNPSSTDPSPSSSNRPSSSSSNGPLPSPQIKFKRFGNRPKSHMEDSIQSSTTESCTLDDISSLTETTEKTDDKSHDNGSLKSSTNSLDGHGFDEPFLKRYGGKHKIRGRLYTAWLNENVDQNNTDFPTPQHNRSASSRPATVPDFPSPLLNRSASDRPDKRYSLLHATALSRGNNTSYSTLSSTSSKRGSIVGSPRVITSPKVKHKSEPGSQHVQYIDPTTDSKTKKISKMLSRATSFGRKDKNKVNMPPRRGKSCERKSRYDQFGHGKSSEVLPKETSV